MIAKRAVLSRVQYLEQGRCRVSTVIVTKLVDLVEHHHRIVYPDASKCLNYPSRH